MGRFDGKYDWLALEYEYVTGTISMRDLADKYGIKHATMFTYAKRNRFADKKSKYQRTIMQKALDGDSDRAAETLRVIATASDMLAQETLKALTPESLYGQVVEMPPVKDEETGQLRMGLQVEQTPKADTKAFKMLSDTLKNLVGVIKTLYPNIDQGPGNEQSVVIMPDREEE